MCEVEGEVAEQHEIPCGVIREKLKVDISCLRIRGKIAEVIKKYIILQKGH